MSTELATVEPNTDASSVERVIATGDLAKLTPAERVNYYQATCRSLGLNPLTQPFQYITLNGKLTLYARRDCTDQLRKLHGISIVSLEEKSVGDIYILKAHARDRDGREDCSTGAVSLKGLAGEALANCYMKAETKAKRRVTLSICGLGFLDETEVETVADRRPAPQPQQPPPADPYCAAVNREFSSARHPHQTTPNARERWEKYLGKLLDRWQAGSPAADENDRTARPFRISNHLVTEAMAQGLITEESVTRPGGPGKPRVRFNEGVRNAVQMLCESDFEWVKTTTAAYLKSKLEPAPEPAGEANDDDEPKPVHEREPGEEG